MEDKKERLQKVMAQAGIASRRKSEELILEGKVTVNGKVITELGFKVGKNDLIKYNNKEIFKEEHVYYVLNKPTGYLSTVSDSLGRRTVMDLIGETEKRQRIYPIGRLDYDTSGVLILTNDGDLAYKLTRSSKEIEKKYQVRVRGIIGQAAVTKLIKGVMIDGIMTKRAKVDVISFDKENDSSLLHITITEGRNRQVRNMCEAVGHEVKKLKRLSFAAITCDDLALGQYRELKPHEIKVLHSL